MKGSREDYKRKERTGRSHEVDERKEINLFGPTSLMGYRLTAK
jgi:hypothetical protein